MNWYLLGPSAFLISVVDSLLDRPVARIRGALVTSAAFSLSDRRVYGNASGSPFAFCASSSLTLSFRLAPDLSGIDSFKSFESSTSLANAASNSLPTARSFTRVLSLRFFLFSSIGVDTILRLDDASLSEGHFSCSAASRCSSSRCAIGGGPISGDCTSSRDSSGVCEVVKIARSSVLACVLAGDREISRDETYSNVLRG